MSTTITLTDGLAWFEDGTSVEATVEQIKLLPQLIKALKGIYPLCDYAPEGYDKELEAVEAVWQAIIEAELAQKADIKKAKQAAKKAIRIAKQQKKFDDEHAKRYGSNDGHP